MEVTGLCSTCKAEHKDCEIQPSGLWSPTCSHIAFLLPSPHFPADSSTTIWSESDGLGGEAGSPVWAPLTTGSHDVFMPPGRRAKYLTWTSCGIMQPFDTVGCHLILGNCEWASNLKQTRFVWSVHNWFLTYLAHTGVKCKIPPVKNRARSGPEDVGICCLDCAIFPFSIFPGLFKQCFGSSTPYPGTISLLCMCKCVCFPQYFIFVHNFN